MLHGGEALLKARQQRAVEPALESLGNERAARREMRAQSPADDVTPELYLYSVLQDFLLYDDMKPVIESIEWLDGDAKADIFECNCRRLYTRAFRTD